MKSNLTKEEINNYFLRSTYEIDPEDNKRLLPTLDEEPAYALNDIDNLVHRIIESKGVLFNINIVFKRNYFECKKPTIFKAMDRLIDSSLFRCINRSFPTHSFNPYVQLFLRNARDKLGNRMPLIRDCPDELLIQSVDKLNDFINSIRKEAKSPEFKKTLSNYKRSSDKNYDSLDKYIKKLFIKHTRLMVLRIDFGYRKVDYIPDEEQRKEMYLQAVNDREIFFKKRESNKITKKLFKHMLGYAWKLEYGLRKGFHYHVFLFFDGSKRWKDKFRARKIGEYWQNNITKGKGIFHSCNANKDGYKYLGIGVINDDDVKLREGLKKAAEYLTKADSYNVRMIVPGGGDGGGGGRTFGKGEVTAKSNKGRPRIRPRVRANSCPT